MGIPVEARPPVYDRASPRATPTRQQSPRLNMSTPNACITLVMSNLLCPYVGSMTIDVRHGDEVGRFDVGDVLEFRPPSTSDRVDCGARCHRRAGDHPDRNAHVL